jgi:hypothetical protein
LSVLDGCMGCIVVMLCPHRRDARDVSSMRGRGAVRS